MNGAAVGDRILVCAGTYTEPDNQILISKSVDVIGNGPGSSIIDGNAATGLTEAGLIRTANTVDGDLLVQGFTVQRAGQVGAGGSTSRYAVAVKGDDAGSTLEFADLEIIGRGAGGRDYGFYADNVDDDVILRDSTLTSTDFNPVLLELVDGAVTVADNEITKDPATASTGIFAFTYGGDDVTKRWSFQGNQIDMNGVSSGIVTQTGLAGGGATPALLGPVRIEDNEIDEFAGSGIAVVNTSGTANGQNGEIRDVGITGNVLTQPAGSGARIGVRAQGLVSDVAIVGNDLRNLVRGISIENAVAGHAPQRVTAKFNRIVGNGVGLRNGTAAGIEAENNWWGCNGGPGAVGCDSVEDAGGGSTDVNPWLVLGVSANPSQISTGGDTSNVGLSMRRNSSGDSPAGVEQLPGGFDVALSTTLGSIAPATVTLDGSLLGTAVLTSGDQAGTATVTGRLDNAAPTTDVAIVAPEPPAPPEPPTPPNDCDNPVVGTPGPDTFLGTPEPDGFRGLGDGDSINGVGGDDCLAGGPGADGVYGGAGADLINGGADWDDLRGDPGDDRMKGGTGSDTMRAGGGNDRVAAGDGRDSMSGAAGDDRIFAGTGRDGVRGGPGDDVIATRDGERDEVSCGAGDDLVRADDLDDVRANCEQVIVRD